jgi:TonB family protein
MGRKMTSDWQQWEGHTVDGKFVLANYLGGCDQSAVFRTTRPEGERSEAAIKLVTLEPSEADKQLRLWEKASELQHPNLVRIFAWGRYANDSPSVVYVVEEFAEENLAQIIPERALTSDEVRGMLGPVLDALDYLHGKGFVHGRIRPSNILAMGDLIKLASDTLRKSGEVPHNSSPYDAPEVAAKGVSAASDVWALGMTLNEALTQHVAAWDAARAKVPDLDRAIPEPLRTIAQRCLEIDPAKRCNLREIRDRLEGRSPQKAGPVLEAALPAVVSPVIRRQEEEGKSPKWPYAVAAAVILAAALFVFRPHSSGVAAGGDVPASQSEQSAGQLASGAQGSAQSGTEVAGLEGQPSATRAQDEVVERAMPDVSSGARRSVRGKIKVRVKVNVDAAGNVTQATVKGGRPSRYFAHTSLDAAKRWKFVPAQVQEKAEARSWLLTFAYTRAKTEASAIRSR